jgi:hypothetical protein
MGQSVYEIQFESLVGGCQSVSFPCDSEGHVDLNALSPAAMENYLYARAMIGREFASPEFRNHLAH